MKLIIDGRIFFYSSLFWFQVNLVNFYVLFLFLLFNHQRKLFFIQMTTWTKKNTHTHRWMVPFERMNRFIIFICLFDDFVIVKFNKFKHILSLPKIIVSGSLGFFFSKTWNDNVCNNKISIICIHFSGRPDNNVRLSS